MKKYPTNAYYAYARHLLEGEAKPTTKDAKVEQLPDKSNDPQFAKVIAAAGTGAAGAVACMKYLSNAFSISSVSSAAVNLRAAVNTSLQPNMGVFSMFANAIKLAVSKALHWVAKIAFNITNKIPALKSPIMNGSSYTVGSIFSMALIGAAIGAVLYKLYKVIMNRRKKSESIAAYNAKQKLAIKKALAESNAMFDELEKFSEGAEDEIAEMTKGGQFIERIRAGIFNMWANVKMWCSNNPTLATVVGIIAALVACWYGVKKYKDSQAKKTTATTESTIRRTYKLKPV